MPLSREVAISIVILNSKFDSPVYILLFSERMTSFICHPEPNGFHSRGGSGLSRSGTSYGPNGSKSGNDSIHHHNTVVASVINEASRRSLNKDQEFDILISKEPDEIRLAEFGEGNGIVMQKNKKNGKPSTHFI